MKGLANTSYALVKSCLHVALPGYFIMPQTLKKLRGHIALGLSVRPSRFLTHAISYEPCMLGF